jgi:hypothetical protein
MHEAVTVLVGTTKGAFLLEGDAARRDWRRGSNSRANGGA